MIRLITIRLMAVAMLVVGTAAVLWAAEEINPLGRPKEFVQGKSRMYGVWYEDGIWRVRTTSGKGVMMRFTGSIEVDAGTITPDYSALEKTGKPIDADRVRLSKGGRKMDFYFNTLGLTDGIDFKVGKNAKTVKFSLRTGDDDDPRFVFIGPKSEHPKSGTFSLPAHPVVATEEAAPADKPSPK